MPAAIRAASQRFGVLLTCSAVNAGYAASLRVWKVIALLDNVGLCCSLVLAASSVASLESSNFQRQERVRAMGLPKVNEENNVEFNALVSCKQ